MPELPEVETVRRSLVPLLEGHTVASIWRSPLALRREPPDLDLLQQALHQQPVERVERAGKYLLLKTPKGGALVHLGMSGQLTVDPQDAALRPHTHLRLQLAGGGQELRYVDPRRFGLFRPFLGSVPPEEWGALGLDPLASTFTPKALWDAVHATERAVKLALLDQGVVAGLGNIYVAEALFLAGIHPARPGKAITQAQCGPLRDAIVHVLEQGIANRGTSLNDYVDAVGESGSNQAFLQVYGREGEPCRTCGKPIRMKVMGARSTFFCAGCQPRR